MTDQNRTDIKKDIIIIGSGPAGLSAAIYAMRADLDTLVIERQSMSGGQIINTVDVDNYPGLPGISGFALGDSFRKHAEKLGASFIQADVTAIEQPAGQEKLIITDQGRCRCRAIVLAMGAKYRMLGVPGEEKLRGKGVSYCATCDGAFFRGKKVAVVGGGDVALEDALFLARVCEIVYLIHRRDEFRGAKALQKLVQDTPNIQIIWETTVDAICGEQMVEMLQIVNRNTGERTDLSVQGVFIAVGLAPNTELVRDIVDCDEYGYICAAETGETSVPGIFAAGDLRTKQLRQVITAASDGANAIFSAEKYLHLCTCSHHAR